MPTDVIEKNEPASDITISKNKFVNDQVDILKIAGNETLEQFGIENTDDVLEKSNIIFPNHQRELYNWYDFFLEYNVDINSAYNTRINSILQTEYEFLTDDTEKSGLIKLDFIKDLFKNILNINSLHQDMLDALAKGFSVIECNWDYEGKYFVPYQHHKKNQNHFRFTIDKKTGKNVIVWIDKSGGNTMTGEPLFQDKFIVHQHLAEYEKPYGKSILGMRSMTYVSMMIETTKALMSYQDRYGIPFSILTLPESMFTEKGKKTIAEKCFDTSSKINGMILKSGMEHELMQANNGKITEYLDTLRFCSNQIAKGILGQSTTSDDKGGSFAKSKTAIQISSTIIKADIVESAETINNFIKLICDINFPISPLNPYISFKTNPDDDLKAKSETYEKLFNMGMPIQKTQVSKDFNIEYDSDIPEDELLIKPEQTQPQLPFSENKKKSDLLEFTSAKEKIARKDWELVDRWFEEGIKVIVKTFKPIYDDILKEASTKTYKTIKTLKKYKVDPVKLNKLSDKYFQYLQWLYLYGMYAMYRDAGDGLYKAGQDAGLLFFSKIPQYFKTVDVNMSLEQMPFDEAIDYFSQRVPMLVEDMIALEPQLRQKAFWLSKSISIDAIEKIQDTIAKGMIEGMGVDEWLRTNQQLIDRLGFVNLPSQNIKAWYMRNVYRTNVSLSYQAGRWQTTRNETVRKLMPYYMYVAVMDDRVRPNHAAFDGLIYRANDPIWNSIYPPNGYACRCTIILLSQSQFERGNYRLQNRNAYPRVEGQIMRPDVDWQSNAAKDWLLYNNINN